VSLPGSLRRYSDSIVSEAQVEGASFLYRGIPRSFLWLTVIFLFIYAAYWAVALAGMSAAQEVLVHVLGLLVGIVLAVALLKLWPRLEQAVPRWFRAEVDGPALHQHHKYLAWAGAALIVLLVAAFVIELTFGAVMIMGLVGGMYILFRFEARMVRRMERAERRLPWLWAEGGWRAFLPLFLMFVLLLIVVSVVGAAIGSNEDPVTHEVRVLPTLIVIIPGIALVVQFLVLTIFGLVQTWRHWMSWQRRGGKTYGPYRTALLNARPASIAYYLLAVNYSTGAFFFTYALMLVMQSVAEARSQGLDVGIDISGSLVSGQALDYLALLSFVIAWVALLLNLSGSAARDENRILNRRVFASLSVFFIMVLFVHVIAARGDEFTISIAFRAMYLAGIALAPVAIIWHRWRITGRDQRERIEPPE
jgi:hypothetical protein